ncbi:MAG: peptidase T [Brevinema sp.]
MKNCLRDYFLAYTAIESQSDSKNLNLPSSEGQHKMVEAIHNDLKSLGVADIEIGDNAILIAKIKGEPNLPKTAFIAHVDTVNIGASPNVKAQLLDYKGKDIVLNPEKNIIFKAEEHPEAQPYIGQEIFFTDGTSVLGADDKAGVAVLTGLAKYLMEERPTHGDVTLIYLPDEEIGLRGAYALDLSHFSADFCYTVDASGNLGRFAYETFNAAKAHIVFNGVSIHPGAAKDRLVNPLLAANAFINLFDPEDTPEATAGRQGYFWLHSISGNPTSVELELTIRDFDLEAFNQRKDIVNKRVTEISNKFPKANICCTMTDEYSNIASALGDDRRCITLAEVAYKAAGVKMDLQLARGGTDGAVLSFKGLPTPNIFTGGLNPHSIFEFLPLPSLVKSFEVCKQIILLASTI